MKFVILFSIVFALNSAEAKPKYGPNATVITESHEYLQKNRAPDYWALSPYYLPQANGKSCSVASVAMVINAARIGIPLTADDVLVTHDNLLKKVNDKDWIQAVDMSRPGGGVALDDLKVLVEKSLKAFGIEKAKVEAVHMDKTKEAKAKLHALLVENEKSSTDFIIINFIQGAYTGDSDVGHISPIGAYDAKKKKVLVMDVDREWYEPYWVSEDVLVDGMTTTDVPVGKTRGYIYIKLTQNLTRKVLAGK